MVVFFALVVFFSCTDDDVLPQYVIERGGIPKSFQIDSIAPILSDSMRSDEIDSTKIVQTDSTFVVQIDSSFIIQAGSSQVVRTDSTYFDQVDSPITNQTDTTDNQTPTDTSPSSQPNNAPVSIAEATPSSGTVPLEVHFDGSNSSDDRAITSYTWNFKDGSTASTMNAVHTFTEVGNYDVQLTTTDEEGLSATDIVTIAVTAPENQGPSAVASANVLVGDAPLTVSFTGDASSDDNNIASYYWDFVGSSSSASNVSHTFNDPGTYDVTLTVTDQQGLVDSATLTITVTEGSIAGQIPCSVGGGKAGETGQKIWCWADVALPSYSGSTGVGFSNNEL